jgi:TM2 domain-containing membrane protein YozV
MIRFACPACKTSLKARDQDTGARFTCPACGQRLQIPGPPPGATKTDREPSFPTANKTVLGTIEPDVRRSGGDHLYSDQRRVPCPFCGEEILPSAVKCRFCEEWLDRCRRRSTSRREREGNESDKLILPAFLFNFFLGCFGAHRFYVGKVGTGVAMLLISLTIYGLIATCIWAFVDFILILCGNFTDADGRVLKRWT